MYGIIGFLTKILPAKGPRLVVYCYHSIGRDGWRFTVTEENFKKQIDFLLKDADPYSASDLLAYVRGEKKLTKNVFVITFDDGYESVMKIKDLLRQKGIEPIVFLLSAPQKANRAELDNEFSFLSSDQVALLQQSGWSIGCHSETHADFSKLTNAQVVSEVEESKNTLENDLATPIQFFAYPKGQYDDRILVSIKKAHYELGFSMNDGEISTATDRRIIPRIGVDGTHTMRQFVYLASPLAMRTRRVIKKLL